MKAPEDFDQMLKYLVKIAKNEGKTFIAAYGDKEEIVLASSEPWNKIPNALSSLLASAVNYVYEANNGALSKEKILEDMLAVSKKKANKLIFGAKAG